MSGSDRRDKSELALIVIDMQEDLCRDERRRHLVDAMLPTLDRVISWCVGTGIPIIFTQYWLSANDEQFERFGDQYCIADTAGAAIIGELQPYVGLASSVIRKVKHSAFFETDLDKVLAALQCETLLIAGIQTHICVMTTAADASFRGFVPVVLSDCVESSTATKKDEALRWVETYVGAVKAAAEVMSWR